jgi:hypothetical protein
MCADFRLGVVQVGDTVEVFDHTSYAGAFAEPAERGDRRWSLLGEINQKQTRPQDRPVRLAAFLSRHPEVDAALDARWGDAPELRALRDAA